MGKLLAEGGGGGGGGGGGAESLESVLSEKQQDGDARVTNISLLLLNFILILVHVLTNS